MTTILNGVAPASQFGSGSSGSAGVDFTAEADGSVVGIRWWQTAAGGPANVTGVLFDTISGAQLASASASGLAGGAWNLVPFPAPFHIIAGKIYSAVMWHGPGNVQVGYTPNQYSAGPVHNADLNGLYRSGRYANGGAPVLPSVLFPDSYGVDLEFTADPPPGVDPFTWDTNSELGLQRVNTEAFIAANPTTLILIPRTELITGTGKQWVSGAPRPAQEVRLIDQSSTRGPQPGLVRAADGVQRRVEYQLVMRWDALLGLYDFWLDSSQIKWEVAEVLPYNGYERRAQVVRYGEG